MYATPTYNGNTPAVVDTPPALTPTLPIILSPSATMPATMPAAMPANAMPATSTPSTIYDTGTVSFTSETPDLPLAEALKKVAALEEWSKSVKPGTTSQTTTDDSGVTVNIITDPDGTTTTKTTSATGEIKTVIKTRVQSNNIFLYLLFIIVVVMLCCVGYYKNRSTTNTDN